MRDSRHFLQRRCEFLVKELAQVFAALEADAHSSLVLLHGKPADQAEVYIELLQSRVSKVVDYGARLRAYQDALRELAADKEKADV